MKSYLLFSGESYCLDSNLSFIFLPSPLFTLICYLSLLSLILFFPFFFLVWNVIVWLNWYPLSGWAEMIVGQAKIKCLVESRYIVAHVKILVWSSRNWTLVQSKFIIWSSWDVMLVYSRILVWLSQAPLFGRVKMQC